MASQSRLEQEALKLRKETLIKNDFIREVEEYSETSDKAKTHDDEHHPHGKGTGHGGHTFTTPDAKKSKTMIDHSQFDTTNGGGSYDKFGRNGVGGRFRMETINIYGPEHSYGVDSVDTTKNIEDGQFVNR